MSLKSLIQRLLDSRTTPAQAAHSALRNTSSSTSIFTGEQIYTAPEDGFITVEGKSEANGGSAIGISSNGGSYFLRTFQSVKDWGQVVTAPVSKGETVSIYDYNLTNIVVKFYKSFGGGYNILVRRALSCLRPSFNFSPKVFSGVKNLGSAPKLFLRKNLFLSQSQMAVLMLRLVMVGCALEIRQLLEQSCIQRWLLPRMCKKERYAMRPLEKAKLLLFSSILKQHKPRPSLFPQSVQTNLRTGGALC